jgi:hypothetical protein
MDAKQRALRNRIREQRTTRRAMKAIATGAPQTARTHLVAAGLDDTTAKRYAGAFSRGIEADAVTETTIKLKKRTRKTVPVKLYAAGTFAARLAVYRPKNLTDAARFEQAHHQLAA